MSKTLAKKVAIAIATVNPLAGQPSDQITQKPLATAKRAENLLKVREFGPYIRPSRDGDDWGGPYAKVVICMESHGGVDDCVEPLDYYGNGFSHSCQASDILKDYYIEFINAGVAAVYPA